MDNFGIKFLGHNIPDTLPVDSISIFSIRIQNTLSKDLYFKSHASFYGPPIKDNRLQISILLDGTFLRNVLVCNDCICSMQRVTLYFPFQKGQEGQFKLQIVITDQHSRAAFNTGFLLFEKNLRVKNSSDKNLTQKIKSALFSLFYTDIPIQGKRFLLNYFRIRLLYIAKDSKTKLDIMRQLKDINRELAFMEKQVRKLKVKSLPCYLSIDTTSRCNLKCKFCYRNYSEEDYNKIPDMSGDVLDKIIKELFPTAWTFNLSSFGEPLLSTQIEKVLKACSDYQVYLSMTTNGTLLKGEEFIKKVASVLHYIEISFDSMDPKLFEKLRDGSSYEQVLRNASKLGEIRCSLPDPKFSLGFSMTLFRQNLMEVPDILEVVHTIGGNFLKTDFGVIFSKKELHSSVLTCPDLYNEIYRIAHERARQIGINLLMRPPFKEDCQWKATKPGICDYLYLSACIRSEEKLNPCYFHVIPSLKVKNGFKSAWNSEIMRRLRAFHDTNKGHPLCKDCYLFLEGNDSVENRRKQFLYGDALE